jgi:hypothetical protein
MSKKRIDAATNYDFPVLKAIYRLGSISKNGADAKPETLISTPSRAGSRRRAASD